MRGVKLGCSIAIVLLTVGMQACQVAKPVSAAPSPLASTNSKPDFESEIKPIFTARCQPCHFQGGQVYAKLPFDRPETIRKLGTRLFTRIKDEKEQRLIRAFLDQ
jgi:hypothetical protein